LRCQRDDFEGIFEAMDGARVTIRTIDPPLHEFLPQRREESTRAGSQMGISYEKVRQRVDSLHEFNPMLGFRDAASGSSIRNHRDANAGHLRSCRERQEAGAKTWLLEVMIPWSGMSRSSDTQEKIVRQVAVDVMKEKGVTFRYLVGR